MKSLSRPARRSRSRLLLLGSAFGLATAPQLAGAESLDLAEVAAALAMPVITGGYPGNAIEGTDGDLIAAGAALTINTVTNTASSPVVLRVDVISGDPRQRGDGASFDEDNWQSTSFDCPITGRETVAFLFIAGGAPGENSLVFADCAGLAISRPLETGNGILFVGIAEPSGTVVSEDLIFGDSIVIDTQVGAAFSFDAVPFQAGAGANDGDKTYAFDGFEYAEFPSLVSTNFLAPSDDVLAELVLFTLDGTTGQLPPPRARLTGVAYNDDEVPFDFQYEFECFDIVQIQEIDPNFVAGIPGLGSPVGHLVLRAQPIGRGGFDAHDAKYGDGNNIRTTPVAGWVVQAVVPGGVLLPAGGLDPGLASPIIESATGGAWGRPLAVARSAAAPFLTDDPATLDALAPIRLPLVGVRSDPASALAMPMITGGFPGNPLKGTSGGLIADDDAVTIQTVTNASLDNLILKIDVIRGDPPQAGGGTWQSTSFDCPLVAGETVSLLYVAEAGGSRVQAECAGLAVSRFLDAENGITFVGVSDPNGVVLSQDAIFGDAVVIDVGVGGAYLVPAFPFRAGIGPNDGDKVYAFDATEYDEFPAAVGTDFLEQTTDLVSELILFTLDGTTGLSPVPRARVSGAVFDGDDYLFDFQYEFDCFDIVRLAEIDPGFAELNDGILAAELQLQAQPVGREGFDAHDAEYGDGSGVRTTPVAGWVVTTLLEPSMPPSPSAELLDVSPMTAAPFLGDDPATLDAQP